MMKDLPKKKVVVKLEKDDVFLEKYGIKKEQKFFDKTEGRLKRMLKAVKIKKRKVKTKV